MKQLGIVSPIARTCFALLAPMLAASLAYAQTPTPTAAPTDGTAANVFTTEGIAGDIDKHHRSPVISVRPVVETGNVKLLVDSYNKNSEFTKYPVRFDFFINRQLFASQIRSPELPGAVGVDVASDIATVPFNYSIVATVLHPNRQYTTVINGAVFSSNLVRTFSCTATIDSAPADSDTVDSTDYVAADVGSTQSGNGAFSVSFTGKDETGEKSATVAAAITLTGNDASGTVDVTIDGVKTSSSVSGTAEQADGTLSSFEVTTDDGATTVSCS